MNKFRKKPKRLSKRVVFLTKSLVMTSNSLIRNSMNRPCWISKRRTWRIREKEKKGKKRRKGRKRISLRNKGSSKRLNHWSKIWRTVRFCIILWKVWMKNILFWKGFFYLLDPFWIGMLLLFPKILMVEVNKNKKKIKR